MAVAAFNTSSHNSPAKPLTPGYSQGSDLKHIKKARFRAQNAIGGRMWEQYGGFDAKSTPHRQVGRYTVFRRSCTKQKKPLPCGNGFDTSKRSV